MKLWILSFVFAFFGYSGNWCEAKSTDLYNQEILRLQDLGTTNNKKLVINTTPLNWFQADRLCRFAKGSLMRIETKAEDDFLIDSLKRNMLTRNFLVGFWLGGRSDAGNKTIFYWIDTGADLANVYSNWGPGQPNSLSGNAMECLDISVFRTGVFWNDHDCNKEQRAICEIPLPPSIPSTTPCPTLPPTPTIPAPTQPRIPVGSITEDPLLSPQFLKEEVIHEDQTYIDLERVVALSTTLLVISLLILFVLVGSVVFMFLRYGPNCKRYSQMNNESQFRNSTITFASTANYENDNDVEKL